MRSVVLAAAVAVVAPALSVAQAEPQLAGRWSGVFVDELTGTELPVAIVSTPQGGYTVALTRPVATEAWLRRAQHDGVAFEIAPYRDEALGVTLTGRLEARVSAYALEGRLVLRTTDGRDVARGRVAAARESEVARR